MTFSIAARCKDTGMFGMAVSSSSPAVAARCVFARAGVGAVASQNITDPSLGERVLDLMALGASAKEALAIVSSSTKHIEYRQLSAVDAQGRTASFSGQHTLGVFAAANAQDVVCAGNLLSSTEIPALMLESFVESSGYLVDRLLSAMSVAMRAGGEAGPVHSAGLLLVDKVSWPVASLRVDWHEAGAPIKELKKLWKVYAPQLDDYVARAQNPTAAPSYGVPGDQ
ncbi:DUF1028 domain-containing protein [Granulosicoccus antarcticus]|uniref:Fimbrial assembly protein FimA n=1 Tax=Granulosicoccus antarcticus IMCC3135 TaxID=1192854 RepID=A0A2Z2NR08_9GAMM|nr:DUF1028 domain-containing protein [Granulosicoccus antarcticus]ASJ73916.1 hypothetical protein IMCC3135_19185 [Granulosicoccus antarcticus IMCC3135]